MDDDFLLLGESSGSQQSNGDSDPSYAFFDHALLETLFYDEMIADSSFPLNDTIITGEDADNNSLLSAEGFSCEQSSAVEFVPKQTQSAAAKVFVNSGTGGAKPKDVPMLTTRQAMQQYTEPAAAQYESTYTGAAAVSTTRFNAPNATSTTSNVFPPTSNASAGAMNEMQIAALQAEYRKGLAAAAVLSQRQQQQTQPVRVPGYLPSTSSNFQPLPHAKLPSISDTDFASIPIIPRQQVATKQTLPLPVSQMTSLAHQQKQRAAKGTDRTDLLKQAPPVVLASNVDSSSNPQNDAKTAEAKKLVSQFALLAEKLGISLPQNVLTSLTTAAVLQGEQHRASSSSFSSVSSAQQQQISNDVASAKATTVAMPLQQQQQQQQKTFAEAIPEKIVSSIASTPPIPPRTSKKIHDTASTAVEVVEQVRMTSATTPTSNKSNIPLSATAGECGTIVAKRRQPGTSGDHSLTNASFDDAIVIVSQSEEGAQDAGTLQAAATQKKRKRPIIEECETKLATLKDENRILKRHLDAVLKKTKSADLERAQAERDMREMVQKQGGGVVDEEKLQKLVTRFTEMYSDYGKSRQQELRFHLEQLRKLATPTTFTKMSLWTLGQNDRFFHHPKKNSLGDILRLELEITPSQVKKIVERRQRIHSLTANIKQALELLEKLRMLCEWKQQIFHSRMSKCQEVLTPLQVVKLLIWVDDNSETLEKVCPGWGSERIRNTAKKNVDFSATENPGAALNGESSAEGSGAVIARKDSESTADSSYS